MKVGRHLYCLGAAALCAFFVSPPSEAAPCITQSQLQTGLNNLMAWTSTPMSQDPALLAAAMAAGANNYIDPRLLLAIAGQESTFGKNQCGGFNAWGWFYCLQQNPPTCSVTDSVATICAKSPMTSWENGIARVAVGLSAGYVNNDLASVATIEGQYCKTDCGSWLTGVNFFYNALGGDSKDVTFSPSCLASPPTFASRFDLATGTEPLGLIAADLDGDGKTDIAVTIYNNGNGDHLTIFRNTGSQGHLQFDPLPVDVPTGIGPEGIAVGDLDNDTKLDLVVANASSNTITVLHNVSSQGFMDFEPVTLNLAWPPTPHRVAIADFDGDGLPDIIVTSNNGFTVSVFRHVSNPNVIAFDPRIDFTVSDPLNELAVADLDGDMKPEIIVPLQNSSRLQVFQNTSTSGHVQATTLTPLATGSGPAGIAVGNLNNDKFPDVVVTEAGGIGVFQNGSSLGNIQLSRTDVATGTNPNAVAIGDLANDGLPEVVVTNASNNTLTILHNTTSGPSIVLTPLQSTLATGATPINVILADIDKDGWQDIIVANHGANTVSIFLNTAGHQ